MKRRVPIKKALITAGTIYFGALCIALVFAWGDDSCNLPDSYMPHTGFDISFLRWIPRGATSWCFVEPPIILLGNYGIALPKPIPEKGRWQVSVVQMCRGWPVFLPYAAVTTRRGYHVRIGARWDDVDGYYTFPSFALKKVN